MQLSYSKEAQADCKADLQQQEIMALHWIQWEFQSRLLGMEKQFMETQTTSLRRVLNLRATKVKDFCDMAWRSGCRGFESKVRDRGQYLTNNFSAKWAHSDFSLLIPISQP